MPLAGHGLRPAALRRRASRPQLKRDPLGSCRVLKGGTMSRSLLAASLSVILPTLSLAQSRWDRYKPGSVAGIMIHERVAVLSDFRSGGGGDSATVVSGADFATIATVQYQDSMRPTPEQRLRVLSGWSKAFRIAVDARRLFRREVL